MKSNFLYLLLTGVFVLSSCDKDNLGYLLEPQAKTAPPGKVIPDFDESSPFDTAAVLVAIIEDMLEKDRQKPFIEGLFKDFGYPLWTSADVFDTEGYKTAIVPFAHYGADKVSGLMITASRDGEYFYRIVPRGGPYPVSDIERAPNKANFLKRFIAYDNLIFGTVDCDLVQELLNEEDVIEFDPLPKDSTGAISDEVAERTICRTVVRIVRKCHHINVTMGEVDWIASGYIDCYYTVHYFVICSGVNPSSGSGWGSPQGGYNGAHGGGGINLDPRDIPEDERGLNATQTLHLRKCMLKLGIEEDINQVAFILYGSSCLNNIEELRKCDCVAKGIEEIVNGLVEQTFTENINPPCWTEVLGEHKNNAVFISDWCGHFENCNFEELNEEGWDGIFCSQGGGPSNEWRYVIDPLNNNYVIDMRHLLYVGYYLGSNFMGDAIEVLQAFRESTSGSALNWQDFYSNRFGVQLKHIFGDSLRENPEDFLNTLCQFLQSPDYLWLRPFPNPEDC